MPLSDALERDDQYKDDPTKSSYMYFFGFKRNKFCVDMTEDTGRYARLANHRRKTQIVPQRFDWENSPRLTLFAKKRTLKRGRFRGDFQNVETPSFLQIDPNQIIAT